MNQTRRKFLKLSLIGAAGLLLTKIFGSKLISSFTSSSQDSRKNTLQNPQLSVGGFKMVKTGNQITFVNSRGEKVLILE